MTLEWGEGGKQTRKKKWIKRVGIKEDIERTYNEASLINDFI